MSDNEDFLDDDFSKDLQDENSEGEEIGTSSEEINLNTDDDDDDDNAQITNSLDKTSEENTRNKIMESFTLVNDSKKKVEEHSKKKKKKKKKVEVESEPEQEQESKENLSHLTKATRKFKCKNLPSWGDFELIHMGSIPKKGYTKKPEILKSKHKCYFRSKKTGYVFIAYTNGIYFYVVKSDTIFWHYLMKKKDPRTFTLSTGEVITAQFNKEQIKKHNKFADLLNSKKAIESETEYNELIDKKFGKKKSKKKRTRPTIVKKTDNEERPKKIAKIENRPVTTSNDSDNIVTVSFRGKTYKIDIDASKTKKELEEYRPHFEHHFWSEGEKAFDGFDCTYDEYVQIKNK